MNGKPANFLGSPRPEQESVLMFIIDRIKDAVINKELQPGDFLPSEADLAKSFGVSKPSVREAIKVLQAMGIVEVKRGQRTKIREDLEGEIINPLIFQFILDQGTTEDLLEFRHAIDEAFTLVAMHKATEEDIEHVRQTLERSEQALKNGHPKMEDDMAFHYAIFECTHNPFIIRTGKAILQLFRATMDASAHKHPQEVLEGHQRIFKAFCQKDENALKEAVMDEKGTTLWKATVKQEAED